MRIRISASPSSLFYAWGRLIDFPPPELAWPFVTSVIHSFICRQLGDLQHHYTAALLHSCIAVGVHNMLTSNVDLILLHPLDSGVEKLPGRAAGPALAFWPISTLLVSESIHLQTPLLFKDLLPELLLLFMHLC